MHGGGDGIMMPEEVDTPGPIVESADSVTDAADIPVPDDGTDFDVDDEVFWQKWLEEIRHDEFSFTGVESTDENEVYDQPLWEPCPHIEYELHNWSNIGYDPTVFIAIHAQSRHGLNHSQTEVLTQRLMTEPLEIELPAMLAYVSLPEELFNEANIYYDDVKSLSTVVLAVSGVGSGLAGTAAERATLVGASASSAQVGLQLTIMFTQPNEPVQSRQKG